MALNVQAKDTATNTVGLSDLNLKADAVPTYVAKLTQSGTDAPVAMVLQNTLGGTVTLARDGSGAYSATLSGAFPTEARTYVLLDPNKVVELFANEGAIANAAWSSTDAVVINIPAGDDFMVNWLFEIRVYPA